MKRLLALLAAACCLALSTSAFAQATAVPDTISYQGRVTDSTGNPVGASSSVNRTALFRIYDNATGGTRLWSEQQTVTIAGGDFSVLLGTGAAVPGEANANPLNAIFTGAQRFLGVTIDDGTAAADTEITPRQQLVTTAFAFRAKMAEAVIPQSITAAMIANSSITATQIADGTIPLTKMAASSVDTTKIVDGTIATADLANGAVTAAKLAGTIGAWGASGAHVYKEGGNVGIGTQNPGAGLSLGSWLANTKLAIWDNSSGAMGGFGWQSQQFRLHLVNAGDRFSFLDGPAGGELMTLLGSGRLGVGFTNPGAKISVGGDLANTKLAIWDNGDGQMLGFGVQGGQFRFHVNNPSIDRFSFLNAPAGAEVFTVRGNGNVGIGHTTPNQPLAIYRGGDARLSLQTDATGSGAGDGLHVGYQNGFGAFIWHHENDNLRLGTMGADRIRMEGGGKIHFNDAGTWSDATYGFRAIQSGRMVMFFDPSNVETFTFTTDGGAFKKGGGNWAATSDRRLKKDIAPLSGALDQLLQLRSVTFHFIDEQRHAAGRQRGFIAQEVEEVFPDWVRNNGPDGFKTVETRGFESLTVQALRELRAEKDAKISELEARIKELESRDSAQTARFDALEKQFQAFARAADTAGNNN